VQQEGVLDNGNIAARSWVATLWYFCMIRDLVEGWVSYPYINYGDRNRMHTVRSVGLGIIYAEVVNLETLSSTKLFVQLNINLGN
jgi:hypothetical protein